MGTYSAKERALLLKTARAVITTALTGDDEAMDQISAPPPSLAEKRGCFVTLHKRGQLRGCIGTIEPLNALLAGVKENALNAAFRDPRFPSVTTDELPEIEIEISVLSVPQNLAFTDGDDLKNKLIPGVHGVILSREGRTATFLPQVWDQLPGPESFLANLCLKAGLSGNAWQDKKTRIKVYEAEHFSEAEMGG